MTATVVYLHEHAKWCEEQCSAYVCGCQDKPAEIINLRSEMMRREPRAERPCDSEPQGVA